ncbi:MAG: hypothetical protein ACYDHP_10750 [Ferrimicrobium sp.]
MNQRVVSEVIPTTMPDRTVLVGVIYDCGHHDLLFYQDGIWALPSGIKDLIVEGSWSPVVGTLDHGTVRHDIAALGPARRPEASRLAKLLQDPRDQMVAKLLAQSEAYTSKRKQDMKRPLYWLNATETSTGREISYVYLHLPKFGTPKILLKGVAPGALSTFEFDNGNDGRYIEKLLDYCYPDRWRLVSRSEADAIHRQARS